MKLIGVNMENFMKYENAYFDFSDIAKISGRNGVGKSSIATAYMWCMFDCDYNLKSNPAVRREVDGHPVVGDVSVTLVFDMDGKEVTARKVQKRSGKDGAVKDTNKYFVNDVQKTKKEFEEYFGINTIFRACSNIEAFLNEKTDYVRSYLFSLAKGKTDLEIAKSSDELADLASMLEKYTVEELHAKSKVKVSEADKKLLEINGQITENKLRIRKKDDIDLAELELLRNSLKDQIAEIVSKQADGAEKLKEYDELTDGILKLKFELSEIQNRENRKLADRRSKLRKEREKQESTASNLRNSMRQNNWKIDDCRAKIKGLETDKQKLVDEWRNIKAETFDERQLICPTCGQTLPEEEADRIRKSFEASKAKRLEDVEKRGLKAKAEIALNNEKIKELEELNAKLDQQEQEITVEILKIDDEIGRISECADASQLDAYKEIANQIREKESAIEEFSKASEEKAALKQEESRLRSELFDCEKKISEADTSEEDKRLEELENQKRELGQQKTDAELILYLLKELEAEKNDQLSDEINQHFEIVQWKLFDYAKNGSYKSVCIPMVDGKSILTTMSNKGNRILGKLDICRSIQKIEGISVPIWLDDCESLDAENQKKVMDMVDGQLIMLIVNNEENLKVEG